MRFSLDLPGRLLIVIIIPLLLISCSGGKNYLPESINGQVLEQRITGKEATEKVNKIHFNPVAGDKENEIGNYRKGDDTSIIYLTYYSGEEAAKADFEKMTNKISPANSVFISPGTFEFEGYHVYRCFGMGQTHLVFVHKSALIWISTGTISSKDFLKEYIKQIK